MKNMTTATTTTTNATLSETEFAKRVNAQATKVVYAKASNYKFLREEDLEDLVQNICLKAWAAFNTYNASQSKLETWVSTIAVNAIKDYVDKWNHNDSRNTSVDAMMKWDEKSESWDDERFVYSFNSDVFVGNAADASLEAEERNEFIRNTFSNCSESDRKVISCKAEEWDPESIARELGCEKERVATTLFHARKRAAKVFVEAQRLTRARREATDSSDDLSFFVQ